MRDEFINIFRRYVKRNGAEELLQKLDSTDFFSAPASTRFHLCREGGLVEHSLHVYKRLRELYLKELAEGDVLTDAEEETIAICGLLHDICKVDTYHKVAKNQKNYDPTKISGAPSWQIKQDELGCFIWEAVIGYEIKDPMPYGHGEKSVYMISKYIDLSEEESMAIRWHMGFSDNEFKAGGYNVGNAFGIYPLAVLMHIADLEATYLDEAGQ